MELSHVHIFRGPQIQKSDPVNNYKKIIQLQEPKLLNI